MLTLRRMEPRDRATVEQLEILPEQHTYVSTAANALADLPPNKESHVIEHAGQIVGFFLIDTGYAQEYSFAAPGEIGLRNYFVDARQQGRGIGRAGVAALGAYLRAQYPHASAVVLTVNCRNVGAISTYLRGGFADTQQLYHGGRAGPQHILRMRLSDQA